MAQVVISAAYPARQRIPSDRPRKSSPQQFVLHLQALDLIRLLCHNVFWCGIFSRPSFRPGLNPCCQPRLSAVIPRDPIFDLRLAQSKLIRYLLPGCTLLPHSQNFFLQFLNMRVFPFTHTNTPCIGLFSYTGGIFSIVHFYWPSSYHSPDGALL